MMTPSAARPRALRLASLALFAVLAIAACAPAALVGDLDTPAARAVDRVAHEAYHRMEIGLLRTGTYTTNVLVDLDLPRGARVTVEAFTDTDYVLRVTSDDVSDAAWLVSPRGVRRVSI
jgi:hypothetical protein